ncbi:unnamed protein product [Spirodela intermedia]|uniref:Uncharacterized protein n=1 Tax=Spirodela intermedia TaxID=51605 RepID=A0A7I8J796_SPIIN|nr:unnamed protein product [Spirodela intermedia]CAA6665292.1 unnamed protein product [Spirodela intermedia]
MKNYSGQLLCFLLQLQDDNSAISRVYESFLSEYPLCYGYWEKYANHKARFSVDQAVEVYEEAVKVATYSVNLWANYCSFGMQFYEDLDDVRRLYERGLTFVGKDYLCNNLWDQYLAFEHSHKQWSRLVDVYIRSLTFPTKKLHSYYQSFKKLVISLEEEIKYQNIWMDLIEGSVASELGDLHSVNDSRIRSIISFLLDQPAALYRGQTLKTILTIGEYFYRRSSEIDEKISYFESRIRRPYFHVKPLDSCQLQTWNHYLDFVETQEDFDWTVKLYERCLIPCANYPEFWVRYIELMEASGGREIATHAIERAVTTFLKRVPQFHEYCAKVKERIGDAAGARSSLDYSKTEFLPNFVDNINQQANMEKRLGNVGAAYSIYEKAIEMLKDKHDLRVTGDLGAAREVFIKGISRAPHCKSLFEGLITFMSIHGGTGEIGYVDSIVERAIVPESGVPLALSLTDRKDVSDLFLQFVDLCGTAHEVRKAWARHLKLFPPAEKATTNGPELLEKTKEITGAGDHDHKPGTPLMKTQTVLDYPMKKKSSLSICKLFSHQQAPVCCNKKIIHSLLLLSPTQSLLTEAIELLRALMRKTSKRPLIPNILRRLNGIMAGSHLSFNPGYQDMPEHHSINNGRFLCNFNILLTLDLIHKLPISGIRISATVQQYVQHHSIQQKNQLILSHQEHQQQMYLQQQQVLLQQQQQLLLQQQQQQQQQQKQETGTLLDAKTSRDNYNLQILAPTRVAEEDGAVHPIPQPPSAPIQ